MQIGEPVQIKDRRHLHYGKKGKIEALRRGIDPWNHDEVLVQLKNGETCYVQPKSIGR